ncbi:glycosyltransferase family 2 protein [Photobacterium phosphoreum]|uniref:glycosyltransferase family 2 protein n=1 Tax=Photobacterium phosphoreum TaxID=659 RepID=UPI0024319A9A|nr:glycosyltransferase family 2 protein [Photobacterium phosphoreum]
MISFSIVICCYNSSSKIVKTLDSILNQKKADKIKYEVIIINNASTDNTELVVNEYICRYDIHARLINEYKSGLIFARKAGVEAAKNVITVFVDDDNILDDNYFEVLNDIFKKKKDIDFIGGASRLPDDYHVPDWFYKNSKSYAVGDQYNINRYLEKGEVLWGAGIAVRTKYLKNIFSKEFICIGRTSTIQLAGDDSEICYRLHLLNAKGYYLSTLKLVHNIAVDRISYEKLINMKIGFGASSPYLLLYKNLFSNKKSIKGSILNNHFCIGIILYIRLGMAKINNDRLLCAFYKGAINGFSNKLLYKRAKKIISSLEFNEI